MTRCSICRTLVAEADERHRCEECGQEYHAQCWTENRGCATYGCKAAPVSEKPTLPGGGRQGWGDEKNCPACDSRIPSSLLVCRHCSAHFPYADPMTRPEYLRHQDLVQRAKSARRTLVVLFILTSLGFPAPLTGGIAGALSYRWRRLLEGPDGAYLALGYGTGVIGCVYAVVFVLTAMGK